MILLQQFIQKTSLVVGLSILAISLLSIFFYIISPIPLVEAQVNPANDFSPAEINAGLAPTPINVPIGPSGYPSLDAAAAAQLGVPVSVIQDPNVSPESVAAAQAGGAGAGAGGAGAGAGGAASEETPVIVLGDGLLNGLYGFVIVFFGKLVVYGAGLFSYGITNFAIGFGELYLSWGIGFAVEESWKTIRDIFNLTFIFGLIYIGFRMILFTDDAQAKRTLVTLIGAALLVNFSLFITKFVIDIANSLAAVIFGGFEDIQSNIGAAFLNLIGLGTVLNTSNSLYDITSLGTGVGLALIFGTMAFMAIAAFVFAAGGILLMIRAIVLTFFMIFSPVMFIGWVFPGLASYSTQYWKTFLGNAFMAPAYIFCIYVSFQILSGFKRPLAEGSNISAALLSQNSNLVIPAIIFFFLAIVLLIASMKVAKTMGAFGAGAALSVGDSARKYTQGVLYRNTGGRLARGALNTLDRAAYDDGGNKNRNWLHRNINRSIQTTARGLGKYTPVRTSLEGAYAYGAGGTGLKATRDNYEAYDLAQSSRDAQARTEKIIADGLMAPAGPAGEAARAAMVSAVTSMSADQYNKLSPEQQTKLAPHLTSSQTDNLLKSEKIPESAKAAIITARKKVITDVLEANQETMIDEIQKLSNDQLETLGAEYITANAEKLTNTQTDELMKSKKFTESQKGSFKAGRKIGFERIMSDPSGRKAIAVLFQDKKGNNRKAKDVAHLGDKVLLDNRVIGFMTKDILSEILKNSTLNPKQRAQLRDNIEHSNTRNKASLLGYLNTPDIVAKW